MDLALLDTDILSEIIKLRHPTVRQKALAYTQQHGALAFSAMTRYEVIRGYRGQRATIFEVTDAIFGGDQPVAERLDGLQENLADRRQVAVEDDRALRVEDAQVHGPGMEIDATVESVLLRVEAHTWCSCGHGSGA